MTIGNINVGTAAVNVTVHPQPPTSTGIEHDIDQLTSFINSKGINVTTFTAIQGSISALKSKISSMDINDETITSDLALLESSTGDKGLLKDTLQSLKNALSKYKSTDLIDPDSDVKTGPKPQTTINRNLGKQLPKIKTTKYKSIGSKVKSIDSSFVSFGQSIGTFINKVKSSMSSTSNKTGNNGVQSLISNVTNALDINNSNTNTRQNTSSKSNEKNNIFNNVAKSMMGQNQGVYIRGTRALMSGSNQNSTNNVSSTLSLSSYKAPQVTSSLNNTTSQVTAYSYDIVTKQVDSRLEVSYSYYPANETQYYTCNYYLNPESLKSLSLRAYEKVSSMSSNEQQQIISTYGLPTTSNVWEAYLVWLLSYISLGVSSQSVTYNSTDHIYPSIPEFNTPNYMMINDYMEVVGNFGITLAIISTHNSQEAQLLSIAIPRDWPSYMYSDEKGKTKKSYELSKALSIVKLISQQTLT